MLGVLSYAHSYSKRQSDHELSEPNKSGVREWCCIWATKTMEVLSTRFVDSMRLFLNFQNLCLGQLVALSGWVTKLRNSFKLWFSYGELTIFAQIGTTTDSDQSSWIYSPAQIDPVSFIPNVNTSLLTFRDDQASHLGYMAGMYLLGSPAGISRRSTMTGALNFSLKCSAQRSSRSPWESTSKPSDSLVNEITPDFPRPAFLVNQ